MTLSTCSFIKHNINHINELQEYVVTLNDLCTSLRYIYQQWSLYEDILDSGAIHNTSNSLVSYSTVSITSGVGRPRFNVGKDQLEYLSSLGFKWTEIAALLGVSRMTVYRYMQ